MLDGLERACGDAELGALLDVGNGLVEQRDTDTEGLSSGSEPGQEQGTGGRFGDLRVGGEGVPAGG
jgi:hypothetical protein